MDFSVLNIALASKSFDKIACICDNLKRQGVKVGVFVQDEWPFAIHILGHIYVDDIKSARFLWKSIPATIKVSQPELVAVWKIVQKLWTRDNAGVHEAIRGFDSTRQIQVLVYTKRMFERLLSAYSTISIQDAAQFLGMSQEESTNYELQRGWTIDRFSNANCYDAGYWERAETRPWQIAASDGIRLPP